MSTTYRCAVYGVGGHAKVVAAAIEGSGHQIACYAADLSERQSIFRGAPFVQPSDLKNEYLAGRFNAIVLAIGSNRGRKEVFERLMGTDFPNACFMPKIVHGQAIHDESVQIGIGTVVFAGAILNPDSKIGCFAIVNTGVIIEHDCFVGDFAHVASGVSMGGRVTIGDGSLIGTGATILHDVTIGKRCIIGAGSVVIHNVPDDMTVVGNPARPLLNR